MRSLSHAALVLTYLQLVVLTRAHVTVRVPHVCANTARQLVNRVAA